MLQETLAARNELLEKFLEMQRDGQQDPASGSDSARLSRGPGSTDDAGAGFRVKVRVLR